MAGGCSYAAGVEINDNLSKVYQGGAIFGLVTDAVLGLRLHVADLSNSGVRSYSCRNPVMFHTMEGNPNLFRSICDQLPQYDGTKRTVVLLLLAEDLEHNLDYGVIFPKSTMGSSKI